MRAHLLGERFAAGQVVAKVDGIRGTSAHLGGALRDAVSDIGEVRADAMLELIEELRDAPALLDYVAFRFVCSTAHVMLSRSERKVRTGTTLTSFRLCGPVSAVTAAMITRSTAVTSAAAQGGSTVASANMIATQRNASASSAATPATAPQMPTLVAAAV